MRPTVQIYNNYTAADFKVWKILFLRQMGVLSHHASSDFVKALKIIDFQAEKIHDFSEVNRILSERTGWGLHTVPSISDQKTFFKFLSQKKFTTTCWLRTTQQLDYLEEPDMFHDVFAHTPLLTNEAYCNFFEGIGNIALKHAETPGYIELLGRIYWFTIEFGLIRENNRVKIYGAGILSSLGETRHALSYRSDKKEFDVETIINTCYRTDIIQDSYFVIDSFRQLTDFLPEIEERISAALIGKK